MISPAVHIKVPLRQFGVPDGHSFVVDFELQFSKDSSLVQVSQLRQFTEKKNTIISKNARKDFFRREASCFKNKSLEGLKDNREKIIRQFRPIFDVLLACEEAQKNDLGKQNIIGRSYTESVRKGP